MRTSLAAVALAVGAAVTIASDTAAHAASTGPAWLLLPSNGTYLKLAVSRGEQARPTRHKATLTCDPAGGTHQRAREACAAIAAVGGDFGALHVDDGACTMQYDPVTVTATGLWRGTAIHYRKTYGNACVLSTETGPVFAM